VTAVHAVVGASGNVGRATALALRARGAPTRVVLRPARDDSPWRNQGIEAAVADLEDSRALARALEGAASAFVLNPPAYGAPDLFERAVLLARSIREAARAARLPRLMVLSSMGAHLDDGTGIIATNHLFERLLGDAAPSFASCVPPTSSRTGGWRRPRRRAKASSGRSSRRCGARCP